ncbi:hypothetical protein ACIA49_19600 [Kribbella sp. NPDC051587]|uniref:hypothetical protein n=1 Tax=Kribbella sp. NPDC051587 TaxID=3364119 RepID=UPI0037A14E73
MGFLLRFDHEKWRVVVEDDDAVAYAYLLDGDAIVSDVWLYNCGPDPVERPWRDGAEGPFCNPAEFTSGDDVGEPVGSSAVGVRWLGADGSGIRAAVLLRERAIAWLEPGARPGWSVRVVKDGPLAKRAADRNG